MSELIKSQIKVAKEAIKEIKNQSISDDRAFSHLLLKYIFSVDYIDQIDLVTDGANDGGVDFLYYDEEESKLIICQSKYTSALSFDQIIAELGKMYSTVQNFKRAHTGNYNDQLKKALQNAMDRLPDDSADNIEYHVFTSAPIDINAANKKIANTHHDFPTDAVVLYSPDDIEKAIQRAQEALNTVQFAKLKLDRPNNYLEYESDDLEGVFCNVSSISIVQLYNKFAGAGLFDLNIRKFIKNKTVDDGVKRTLDQDRENFWFLNNGIIIACTDYDFDGDVIKLENFSIVNGGQTTTLISTYKGTNTKEFYIPCKIVATKDNSKDTQFYARIAEATNSQKPIYPRDLKSNAPEMVRLGKWLQQEDVYLEIKRGFKSKKKNTYSIKNDELGQIVLSFAFQMPGTARSGKKKMFDTPSTYDKIFKVNYEKDPNKKSFLLDLVKLNAKYALVENKYKAGGLTQGQKETFLNGKQAIFALIGVCYRLVNGDITEEDLLNDPKSVNTVPFTYGGNISNYTADDLDSKIEQIILSLIDVITEAYELCRDKGQTTSISNYLKTDSRYWSDIVAFFIKQYRRKYMTDLRDSIDILKRN